ncbi:hypothetical protein INT48_005852 [Thamnidium elegans]|uniref:Uncharacterized protein n=1 Tax=Thamnidium elegans TaxID=101142 RepID=A0A8H7VY94_9FUNG|nr:hypothetical protein INT48_005852 [Thamnidium elegans]
MSSSPRFWQKLGLGKQSKNSSTSTSNSVDRKEGLSMHSSISFNNVREATLADNTEKQAKRFSNMSLRHRASSASLNQQMTSNSPPDKLLRRGSYMKPLRRIDPEESNYLKLNESYNTSNIHDRVTSSRISPDLHQQRKLQKPTRKPSIADIRSSTEQKPTSKLRQPSPAIAHAKLLSRSESSSSINSTMTLSKRKKNNNVPKLSHSSSGDDDTKSLTRSSSNGSTADRNKRKSSLEKRKSKQPVPDPVPAAPGQDFIIDMLKDELEKEKASSRSLQGQKEAISKDLDYFCNLVDEVTEEKDTFKQKYEQEKLKNEELKQSLEKLTGVSSKGAPTASQLKIELETVQQRATEDQYVYYNNLQFKTDENNKLRHDLKQAQRQIQVLRKTMEQMLRADGKDFDDHFDEEDLSQKSAAMFDGGEKYLLLQTGYHPDQQSPVSSHLATTRPTTNPPSPTPCYSAFSHDDDEDLLSTTSKESYQSGPLRHPSQQHYDFLKYDIKDDDAVSSYAKRKSAEYSKKIAMSRRRKDQLEEMLGEVDSQLNKVKQKMRPS